MIGIPLGLITANAYEWMIHKHVLHGMGKKRGTFWAFHFHEHHGAVRKHDFYDPHYERFPLGAHAQGKEAWSLIAGAAVIAPLFPIAPFFVGTLWYCSANYYRVHKKAHRDPAWARSHLRWHYDHHMGANPSANWCVTKPWFDYVMGTREFMPGENHESNVLGLARLPRWLQRHLPNPESRAAPAPRRKTEAA